ncbi:esterase/lipase family protein [Methanosphaerula palustris]|uniref:Acetyltransferase or hydrolase with the alpha/beta hydrolase fold-like protein n=1 Tax=Methanosphaerula palustris (strain ATCC BAA-1556 / DSM 19958 / E1-9c) TaxID=521011 RepID=B8GHB7_METPE|nr:alpha/beta fold hydrolase [Methanosphaerula palustris]ACL16522.1 acetyltransferase or hydrolase with the alpha/beta hydrolase fold-like protein [Methanosphaerula palustris E1-9c]
MCDNRYPVILVHGWNSHPGIWKRLVSRLDEASIPYRRFDHTGMKCSTLPEISESLHHYLQEVQDDNGWSGPIDIVCHSLGACIVRYLLEVMDGTERAHTVRQLICLGPTNNGSALAELFNDPQSGKKIIEQLTGVFIPQEFDPAVDPFVQDVRPRSTFIHSLCAAGLRSDIIYRIIVTANPNNIPGFFPWFEGKTWEIAEDGKYQKTLNGDGIVAHRESALSGIPLDILSAPLEQVDHLTPDQYCHIYLPKNPIVIEQVMQFLTSEAD